MEMEKRVPMRRFVKKLKKIPKNKKYISLYAIFVVKFTY